MERSDFNECVRPPPTTEYSNSQIRQQVEYVRHVPNKDNEFKVMRLEDELQKNQNKNEEVDDWSMYDNQYPRLGPAIKKQ